MTKKARGILFDEENQSVDQQYSFAERGLRCASSGFVTTNVGYHAVTSRIRPLARVSLFDYRQDCSRRCNGALCLELRRQRREGGSILATALYLDAFSTAFDSKLVLSTKLGLLSVDLRNVGCEKRVMSEETSRWIDSHPRTRNDADRK